MFEKRIVIAAAHPDDETIGLGGQLASMHDVTLVHLTDGAPRSRPDWKDYARVRRVELLAAAAIAGIPEDRCIEIGVADQEASRHLVELSCQLSRVFEDLGPAMIFTHPYEGGHPDHDAAAFAVHHATHSAELWEFSSYHRRPLSAEIETGCFLGSQEKNVTLELSPRQRALKQRMLDCFVSQRDALHWFRIEDECIRRAPEYDFTQPAHVGRLFYESYDWGLNSSEWVRLARRADRMIGPCLSR
jgi:LmbE family N-acetylglucosaminyl deacetylase